MDASLIAPLTGLALIDSTSFGTLLIPLWLMLAPGRLRAQRVLLFLGTVAGYYLVLGAALLLGATALAEKMSAVLLTPAAAWAQLLLGAALLIASFVIKPARQNAPRPAAPAYATDHPVAMVGLPQADGGAGPATVDGAANAPATGRVARWRARAMGADGAGSTGALVALAISAALIETVSMVPYLSAIGLLTAGGLPLPTGLMLLAGYCLVMIAPALVLLAARLGAADLMRTPLQRLESWLSRNAAETTAWVIGIVGFLIARDALLRTGLIEMLTSR